MPESYLRQNALAWRGLDAINDAANDGARGDVRITVCPPLGQLCLRGDSGGAFASVVETIWGVPLPIAANTVNGDLARRILWLGPDEWLAICAADEVASLQQQLNKALGEQHALVSDVSHSRVLIALEGPRARDVLGKGCSLDLDPVAFEAGRCAQSTLARAHMLLHQYDAAPGYHVYAHRSFADYVYAWLADAAREYC